MMGHRFVLALLVLGACLGFELPLCAQPADADQKLFEQTKAAADKGDAEAELQLSALYASGTGVARDLGKAAKWHRKAAEQGLSRAQLQLGLDYASGAGVKPDKVEAVKWLRRAADQGLPEAELYMGLCYANGDGVRENAVEAIGWYRKAADKGLPQAVYEVGKSYLEGTGVAKDIAEGIKWIRQAAEAGHASAQNRLGECYVKGEGVTTNYVQAYKWFNLAAGQDGEDAGDIRVSLAKVQRFMTPAEITEAQRQAAEFKPKAIPSSDTNAKLGSTNSSVVPSGFSESASAAAGGSKIGIVNVRADDESYEVFADGAFVGNSPAALKLGEGNHVIEVKKAGFKDYRREIQVGAGADLNLRVVLEKQ
jgi:TPR repeat protein